jgi:hypothetical protein
MKERQLSNEEALSGYNKAYEILLTDLQALGAVSTGTINLEAYTPGVAYQNAGFKLVEAVDGATSSACAFEVGYNGGTTDDVDGFLDGYEIHADATEITYGLANGADFATLKTGYVALDSGTVQASLTLTNGVFSALTAGAVTVFLKRANLNNL